MKTPKTVRPQPSFVWIAVFLLAVAHAGCKTSGLGYSFKLKKPSTGHTLLARSQIRDTITRLSDSARVNQTSFLKPLVHSVGTPDLARRDRQTRTAGGSHELVNEATCSRLRPLASFVHLSDGQIKDPSVDFEPPLTRLHPSADRDPDYEKHGYGTLLATVLSVNSLVADAQGNYAPCPDPLPPQFVVHTGDALDASMFSELYHFLAVMNTLAVPFLNVVGNHDDLFFGTLPPAKISGFNIVAPFVPVHGYRRFMQAHNFEAAEYDISIPAAARDMHEPTAFGDTKSPLNLEGSTFHGFELACRPLDRNPPLCKRAQGYYTTEFTASHAPDDPELPIRLIILNTFDWPPETILKAILQHSQGRMREAQFDWLDSLLTADTLDRSATIVFGHHPFGSFQHGDGDRLRDMLANSDAVVAYFTGHTHEHELRVHDRSGQAAPLWEVIGGANISYPQFGVHVELLEDVQDTDAGYIRLRSFEERISLAPVSCPTDDEADWPLPCVSKRARDAVKRNAGNAWQAKHEGAVNQANGMLRVDLKN